MMDDEDYAVDAAESTLEIMSRHQSSSSPSSMAIARAVVTSSAVEMMTPSTSTSDEQQQQSQHDEDVKKRCNMKFFKSLAWEPPVDNTSTEEPQSMDALTEPLIKLAGLMDSQVAHRERVQDISESCHKFLNATQWMFEPIDHYVSINKGRASVKGNDVAADVFRRVGDSSGYPFSGVFNPPDDLDLDMAKIGCGCRSTKSLACIVDELLEDDDSEENASNNDEDANNSDNNARQNQNRDNSDSDGGGSDYMPHRDAYDFFLAPAAAYHMDNLDQSIGDDEQAATSFSP